MKIVISAVVGFAAGIGSFGIPLYLVYGTYSLF